MPIDASPSGTLDIENATLRSRDIVALTNLVAGNDVVRGSGAPTLEVYGDPGPRLELVSNTAATDGTATFTRLESNVGVFSIQSGTDASDNGTITFGGFQNERMRINADGNVGIGVTDPGGKLNVKSGVFLSENQASTNGVVLYYDEGGSGGTDNNQYTLNNAKFGTGIFVNDTGTTGSTITLMNKEGANNTTKHASIGFVNTDTTFNGKFGGQIGFWPEDINAVKQQFRIYTSGASAGYNLPVQQMVVTGDGNVGIGTTSPTDLLDVHYPTHSFGGIGTQEGSLTVSAGGEYSNAVVYFRTPFDAAAPAKRAIFSDGGGFSGGSSGGLHFCLESTSDNTTKVDLTDSKMVIKQNGNVGIGTATPAAPLQIGRELNSDTWSVNSGIVKIAYQPNGTTNHYGLSIGVSGTYGDGVLQTFNNVTGAQYDLQLQPVAGNVGIGTTNPLGKLHIYEPTGTSHGINVGTLILDRGNINGSSSIVFTSRGNNTSDYAYITYNENYGEAGGTATENGVLLLGSENDGTGSSDHVRVKTRLVVEADMDTTEPTYAFQVKSSNITSDLFNVHRGGSIGINGNDPNIPFTIDTNKYITVNGGNYNSYCRWFRGSGNWYVGSDYTTDYNQNLYWFANITGTGNPLRPVITFENDQEKGTVVNVNTFTGQHRNVVRGVNPTTVGTYTGLIVSADNNENIKVNGGVERGLKAITINETIPYVSVTTKAYDKQVFGVVSGSEDPESRQDTLGRVTSTFTKEEGDDRIFINSLGEGAMWISNQNGPLTSGDYVTSSHIPGYGMKQDSEFLANYTVAKITIDCDFLITSRIKYKIKTEFKTVDYYRFDTDLLTEKKYNLLDDETKQKYTLEQYEENVNILDEHGQLQWEDSGETEDPYQVRYLLPDGTQISEEEYTTRALADEKVYIAAFVGCTYHCG